MHHQEATTLISKWWKKIKLAIKINLDKKIYVLLHTTVYRRVLNTAKHPLQFFNSVERLWGLKNNPYVLTNRREAVTCFLQKTKVQSPYLFSLFCFSSCVLHPGLPAYTPFTSSVSISCVQHSQGSVTVTKFCIDTK